MSSVAQARHLLPVIGGERASANAFLGAVGVGSLLGWAVTYLAVVWTLPPGSGPVGPKTGAWLVTGAWAVLFVLGLLVAYFRVDRGVLFSAPMLAWTGLIAIGFVASAWGTANGNVALMWGAWYGVFVVGYLLTAALVTRPGIYYLAGVLSLVATGVVFFALDPSARPHSFVLGVLGVVPPLVDAAMGGRQLNEDGVPVLKAERLESGGAGGVVET